MVVLSEKNAFKFGGGAEIFFIHSLFSYGFHVI